MSRVDGAGRQRLLDLTISAFRDEVGTTRNFVLISRDVTQLVELEKRLQQTQKLESIGTLAGGIAHDFNNLLTPILGLSDLLVADAAGNEAVARSAREIHEAAGSARDLVRQILTFARDVETPKVAIDVNREVEEVAQLLRAILPATIDLVVSPSPEPAWIMMGPAQLHQVLMNLATNAFHAMEEKGGKLQLSVQRENGCEESSGRIHLVVQDSGPGVPPDIQGRIFDPFFSTKGKSKGTGLGLASVHGIVQSMGGRIWLDQAEPHGACFHILLPACSPQMAEGRRRQALHAGQHSGTIALVDDEAQVLEFSQLALTRLGYQVKSFSDPQLCLAWLEEEGSEVDLLITDQTMPQLTGLQLIEQVRYLYPHLKVLLVTGYSQDALHGLRHVAHGAILHKPYHLNELAEAVQNLLHDG
jgi:signal transduction histidine kinase/CheY-like chemotaxis protein